MSSSSAGLRMKFLGRWILCALIGEVFSPVFRKVFFRDPDYFIAYARNKGKLRSLASSARGGADARYDNPDNDPRGPWKPGRSFCKKPYCKECLPSPAPLASRHFLGPPPATNCVITEDNWKCSTQKRIWWGMTNQGPAFKRFSQRWWGLVPETIWPTLEVGIRRMRRRVLSVFNVISRYSRHPQPVWCDLTNYSALDDEISIVLALLLVQVLPSGVLSLYAGDGGNRDYSFLYVMTLLTSYRRNVSVG
jgi:hypothetical protein